MQSGVGGVAPRAGEEIAVELIRRRQRIDQDELEFSVLAAQFAETDEYEWQGFDSAHAWLKANCHISGGGAPPPVSVGPPGGDHPPRPTRPAGGGIRVSLLAPDSRASN